MERLTRRSENGTAIYNTPSGDPVKWENNRHEVLRKLAEYEDLEEQRKLIKLPCAVGDTVYYSYTNENKESEITEMKVGCIEPFGAIRQRKGICEVWNVYAESDYTKAYFKFLDFGKTVFITKEEAEAASKELSSKE